jgi:hypothetical protein
MRCLDSIFTYIQISQNCRQSSLVIMNLSLPMQIINLKNRSLSDLDIRRTIAVW